MLKSLQNHKAITSNMMSSLAFMTMGSVRESDNHFQRFGALDWETQFAFWHSVFLFWWILLIALIRKSPEADVDYRQALGSGFACESLPGCQRLTLLCSVSYHTLLVICLLAGDSRSVSVSKLF